MIGLGLNATKNPTVKKTIVRDGLVLRHDYKDRPVEPVSSGAADINAAAAADEYIDVGVIPITTNDVTISAWVYITAFVDEAAIFCNRTNSGDKPGVELRCDENGFEMFIDKGSGAGVSTVSAANTNQWYHVCGVWDRSDKSLLYVDGVLVDSDDISGHSDNLTHSQAASIGKNVSSKEFRGYVCNVGYWNAALNQPQIKSIMHKDYAALSASEKDDLVSWWNLDSTIPDVSNAVYDNHHGGGELLSGELGTNVDFESGFTDGLASGWTSPRGNVSANTTTPYQGTSSQSITNPAGNSGPVYQSASRVLGSVYSVSFWAKNIKGSGGYFHSQTYDIANIDISSTDWTFYSFTAICDDASTIATIFYANSHATNDTNGISIDNVSVKLVNGNTGTLA